MRWNILVSTLGTWFIYCRGLQEGPFVVFFFFLSNMHRDHQWNELKLKYMYF